jgi:hypothetical protein
MYMATISETGHKINVANLETLISVCTGYGAKYNPVKKILQLPDLNTMLSNAQKELANVNQFISLRDKAITARHYAFEPLSGIVSKVVYAVKASDVPKMAIGEIEAMARKLKGTRKTAKVAGTPEKPLTPEEEARKYISVSQLRFDSRIENLDKLIQLLKAQPSYTPNESELSVGGLTALLDKMKSTNTEAINAATALSNARIQRNKVLYDDTTGLVSVCNSSKTYIKSVFGTSSPEYALVRKLKFTKSHIK